jgi:hypothetical protein
VTDFRALLLSLTEGGVNFIIVGGAAAIAHGSARLTLDLDIVYERTADNVRRLVKAFARHRPYPRGAPAGLPFVWHERTVMQGLNFRLSTALGDLDILGEITGGGGYGELLPHTILLQPFGVSCRCLTLGRLIHVKRAAGRPKDLETLAELESIWEETES